MDGTAFDAWTRRRFGLAAGGTLAALLSSLGRSQDAVEAGKKHKRRRKNKKRCRRVSQVCDLGGNRKRKRKCCRGLRCDRTVVDERAGIFCCKPEGAGCDSETFKQCCSRTCEFFTGSGACSPCRGRGCGPNAPCCGGLECQDGFCGGCRSQGTTCTTSDQCCFSNCESGSCLSAAGGPCSRDIDCRTCYLSPPPKTACNGACVNGACTV